MLITTFVVFSSSVQKSTGPAGCYSGEPPRNTNCTSCHFGNELNSGNATVNFSISEIDNGYLPNEIYQHLKKGYT